jgi:hypothetical protein
MGNRLEKKICKIPFPPHSWSLRTRAERSQRIIEPVQNKAVYDVKTREEKINLKNHINMSTKCYELGKTCY